METSLALHRAYYRREIFAAILLVVAFGFLSPPPHREIALRAQGTIIPSEAPIILSDTRGVSDTALLSPPPMDLQEFGRLLQVLFVCVLPGKLTVPR